MGSGLSKTRLARLHDAGMASIERNQLAGAVTLLERHGESHVDVMGLQDIDRNIPMKRDSLFRLASLSKPITATAAMILVEEGKLRLDEPVDRLLPELANRQVMKRYDRPIDDTVPAKRPITLRDCLTFRVGHGMLGLDPPRLPIEKAMFELELGYGKVIATNEWIKRLGSLPLLHQPGEQILYNTSFDIAGILIARAAGQSLASFLKERIFDPLGMKDTGLGIPEEKVGRLTSCYYYDPQAGRMALFDDAHSGLYLNTSVFESGAGGIVTTADDLLQFGRMMLNYGKLGKERILSRPTVEAMTIDQVTEEQKRSLIWFPRSFEGRGWGFGMSMYTERRSIYMTPGAFGWEGGFSAMWSADPTEDMTCILMAQRLVTGLPLGPDFYTLAYQAIDD